MIVTIREESGRSYVWYETDGMFSGGGRPYGINSPFPDREKAIADIVNWLLPTLSDGESLLLEFEEMEA